MKRRSTFTLIILIIFAALMICSIPVRGANSSEAPTIIVGNREAYPGETVELTVRIENNPGILGATLNVAYGDNVKLLSAENGIAFSALSMTSPGRFTSGCSFIWYAEKIDDGQVTDGTILKLRFLVSENAAPDTVEQISISYHSGDIFDNNLNAVSCTVQNGTISIAKESASVQCSEALIVNNTIRLEYQSAAEIPDATVFLASYSTNGRFHSCSIKSIHINAGKNEIEFNDVDPSLKYKAFTMQKDMPLCSAVEPVHAFTVQFKDYDGTVLSSQLVPAGEDAVPPQSPQRSGYIFVGWSGNYTNIQADCVFVAQYKEDTTPTIVVESAEGKAGDSAVTVKVRIRNNPGILGMTLKVTYDATAIELIDSASGAAVSKLNYTKPGRYKNGCVFAWYADQLNMADIADGELLILTFRIPSTTLAGEYPIEISYTYGDVFDRNLQSLNLKIENGSIRVK